jgi:anti-sigma regulatory factor (Ser/Thr protein kinase)
MSRLQWQLPPTARSVPEARHHVVTALEQWDLDGLVDTARLLTSELVTNAVLHARTEVTLGVEEHGPGVRISVRDLSPVTPSLRHHSTLSTTGRGLRLLDQLADEWNVVDHKRGKTIWFTLTTGRDAWSAYGDPGALAEAEA